MKIAICENEQVFSDNNKKRCQEYLEEKKINGEISIFKSGEEFLADETEFDILLLDIEMEELTGIDVKKELENRQSKTAIIFLTSHSKYMSDAFGKYVYKFLSKPLEKKDLFSAFDTITKEIICDFVIELEDDHKPYIMAGKIIYIKAEDKYSIIKTKDEEIVVRKTMKWWEEILSENDFIRAHKSYIVNMSNIKKIGTDLILEDGTNINIGRKSEKILREKYNEYLRKILG